MFTTARTSTSTCASASATTTTAAPSSSGADQGPHFFSALRMRTLFAHLEVHLVAV